MVEKRFALAGASSVSDSLSFLIFTRRKRESLCYKPAHVVVLDINRDREQSPSMTVAPRASANSKKITKRTNAAPTAEHSKTTAMKRANDA